MTGQTHEKRTSICQVAEAIFSFFTEVPHLCLVQYIFDEEEHEVLVLPHGNNKNVRAAAAGCVRTKKSVVDVLKEVSVTKKPKQAFHQVNEERGGILKAKAESDLPRNRAKTSTKPATRTVEGQQGDRFCVTCTYEFQKAAAW